MENILVTGGCGFIGSHLVDCLTPQQNNDVTVLDNLSAGSLDNLRRWKEENNNHQQCFHFINEDLRRSAALTIPGDCKVVYHMAANPDVRVGSATPAIHFEENILSTFNLLEAVRKAQNVELFVFTSTSTVYGEAEVIPTPEDYGPLRPISMYGASKLACEALVSSYASTYDFRAVIFRLANIIGKRSTHGIIYDLMQKLRENPLELEILGDGNQTKSYLYIKDCINGILAGVNNSNKEDRVSILNIGSEDQINVMKIAEIVCSELGFVDVKYKLTPATVDGRGWPGDVKLMSLDVSKLKSLGWKPQMNSEEAVTQTVRELVQSTTDH